MVVVEEDHEDTDVAASRFALGVVSITDLGGWPRIRLRHRTDLDAVERLDVLEFTVLVDLEIGDVEIGEVVAIVISHDGIDTNEINP